MIEITNINRLKLLKEYPLSVLSYFDPKIEYINTKENNGKTVIYLKFRGEKREYYMILRNSIPIYLQEQ